MTISDIPEGRLVLAISGGVDSVVLLDVTARAVTDKRHLIVAHVNHGMRPEADWDQRFVEGLAKKYGLDFKTVKYHLKGRSEEVARSKRYQFLQNVAKETGATAIVTAHHRDDVIETMVMNTLRGTHTRGLIALRSRDNLYRPLISFSKQQIYEYALGRHLEWMEDASNLIRRYTRNRIRLDILPKMRGQWADVDDQLLIAYQKIGRLYDEIEPGLDYLDDYLAVQRKDDLIINRQRFIALPSNLRREWLVHNLDKRGIERSKIGSSSLNRMEQFICTGVAGKSYSPQKTIHLVALRAHVRMRFHPTLTSNKLESDVKARV